MNTVALYGRISRVIQDASFSESDIVDYINEGLRAVCGEVPLPELETSTTLTATDTQDYVALPADFLVHLRFAYLDDTNRKLAIMNSLTRLREITLGRTGANVVRVCVSGGNLFYAPVPGTSQDINIVYHKKPTAYTGTEDEPDYIPANIGPRILLAYACREIYELIEDGAMDQKVNTVHWTQKYQMAMDELKGFLGPMYAPPVSRQTPYAESQAGVPREAVHAQRQQPHHTGR